MNAWTNVFAASLVNDCSADRICQISDYTLHPACKKTGCWFVAGDDLTVCSECMPLNTFIGHCKSIDGKKIMLMRYCHGNVNEWERLEQ